MTHIAVIAPEVPGHANSMSAICRELAARGHRISWIGTLDGRDKVAEWGFESIVIGEQEFPPGFVAETMAELGKKSGYAAVKFTLGMFQRAVDVGLREVPTLLRDIKAEALLADESVFTARTYADSAEIKWASVCSALPFHPDPHLPPGGPILTYGTSLYHRIRNQFGYALARWMLRGISRSIMTKRREWGLPEYDFLNRNASTLCTVAQITEEFDFPRKNKPDWFHYVGSFQQKQKRTSVEFPFDKLDGRPLIYASMGTLQNRLYSVFTKIAEACENLSAQLVISLGGGGKPSDLGELRGDPIVVEFAPQLEVIDRASVVITHAGMNTATECMAAGVPMLALPVTNDQPAVAARIAYSGCGLTIPVQRVSASRMKNALTRLLSEPQFKDRAQFLAEANRKAGGLDRAVDLIEGAFTSS